MLRYRVFPLVLAALVLTAACAQRKPGQPLQPGFNLFSKEQDVQLGQEAAQQARQQLDIVNNQFLESYLNTIGKRLASTPAASQAGFPFSFTMVNDESVNAFALPGGPMFVNTGLVQAATNEAQLAGVMAHEMAHVILRHGTNQVSRAQVLQLPAMLAAGAAGGGLWGQLAQLGVGIGYNSILLNYSRGAESESDALGARIMAQAGYNPIESARFFETLAAEGGARGPQFLSSHPDPGNRMRAIEAEIRTMPSMQYGDGTGQFEKAKQATASLPKPTKTRTAMAQPPSQAPRGTSADGWQELRARTFRVSYPADWQAYGGPESASVTLAPEQGIVPASDGSQAVGYGAVLSYYVPANGARAPDLRRDTEDLIARLRSLNPGLRPGGSGVRQVSVGGAGGLLTVLEGPSPYGGRETNALLTVARPEGLFYMVFVAPERDFNRLSGVFEQMIRSISFAA